MDIFTPEKRKSIMARVKNKDSKLELKFRKELWNNGLRYRKNVTKYFGKPDLVFRKKYTVVFIDSCFWHFCPLHRELPKQNSNFWKKKLVNNSKRDEDVTNHYTAMGWNVIRVWEHDLISTSFDKEVSRVVKILGNQRLNK